MFVLGALIVALLVVSQINGGRFPAYRDLAIALCLPFIAYALLAGMIYFGCYFFPVRIGPEGIKSTNMFGMPTFIAWRQIRAAYIREVEGIPYIFIESERTSHTITVPVWLRNPESFVEEIRKFAGPENPLTTLVQGADKKSGIAS